MSRRRNAVRVGAVGITLAALAVGAAVGLRAVADILDDDRETTEVEINTATASVGSLTYSYEAAGTIGYESPVVVESTLSGTVLEVVEPGDTVSSGDVLARIDDHVVVWLSGDLPAWRSLGVGDDGDDVEQLELALTELGFNDGTVTVDDDYTDATASMVERWQESLDVEPTGTVELGSVVSTGDRDRVASVEANIAGLVEPGPLLSLGSSERVVTIDIDPAQAVHLEVGDTLDTMLPDRNVVTATVASVTETSEIWTVTAAVDGDVLPERDTITVDAGWDHIIADDALTVPSSALLRLDNGSYVVDVVDDSGGVDRRQVALGVSVGARTEIVSGLAPGDVVVVL
jgi:multidrug efflux pump subunit AcrA (membrane-fusion protein)